MKKILNMLLLAAAMTLQTACTSEVDDVFPESSAQRIAETIAETKQTLQSSSTGWLMRMYGDPDFGGYNVLCKFEGDYVTVVNELYGNQPVTSHYKVDQSAGAILSFDEYNEVFHFFSDPANPAGWGDNGKGFQGDLEFRVLQVGADSIILKGKKNEARIVMTPAPADWEDYLNKVAAMEESISSANYVLTAGDKKLPTTNSYRCFAATDTTTGVTTEMPYIVTDKGVEFYRTYTVNGKQLTAIDCSQGELWPEVSDNTTTLAPVIVPANQQLVDGQWYVSYSNMGSVSKQYWNSAAQSLEQYGMSITMAEFGTDMISETYGNNFGLLFVCYIEGARNYYGQLLYDYKLVGDDEIEITGPTTGVLNGDYFSQRGMNYAAATFRGTFKVTTDNLRNPSYLLITDTTNPNRFMKLSKKEVAYPMKN